MRDIKTIYKAFLLAPSALLLEVAFFIMFVDAYQVYIGNASFMWYLFRFFRRYIQFFTLILLIYLPPKKYLSHKLTHKTMIVALLGLTFIATFNAHIEGKMILADFKHWNWGYLATWGLLMLINYLILHRKTGRVVLSFLFSLNIAFIMGVVYELIAVMLNNNTQAILRSPFLVGYGCFILFLYRLEARLNKKLALTLLFSSVIILIEWCLFDLLPWQANRFFTYPLGITTALTIPKRNV